MRIKAAPRRTALCCRMTMKPWRATILAGLLAEAATAAPPPAMRVDPAWPQPLPHNWALGQVSGIATDAAGDVWILQRPATMADPRRAKAPPVIEFDPAGRVLRAWGGPGRGYDWFENEHSIAIDAGNDVWLSGNGQADGQVLKFTADGSFLLQIGGEARGADSASTTRLGRPAGIAVDPAAHEVYIADGYANHRVIVFDADTGAFRRMWGAYGGVPSDHDTGIAPSGLPRQFATPVHCVRLSHDGRVYVCDRRNDRVQIFTPAGHFLAEWRVAPQTRGMGSAWDLAFSPDPAEQFAYVADGQNNVVRILRRADGTVLGEFGDTGHAAGQFAWVHGLAVDKNGDVFTAEVHQADRVQRFVPERR
jgi:DNA-binding beta-propeller fold protein YncE